MHILYTMLYSTMIYSMPYYDMYYDMIYARCSGPGRGTRSRQPARGT